MGRFVARASALVIGLFVVGAAPAYGQSVWDPGAGAGVSRDWNASGNWTPAGVPNSDATQVQYSNQRDTDDSDCLIAPGEEFVVGQVSMQDDDYDGTLIINGTLRVAKNSLPGSLTWNNGGDNDSTGARIQIGAAGLLKVEGDFLYGNASLTVVRAFSNLGGILELSGAGATSFTSTHPGGSPHNFGRVLKSGAGSVTLASDVRCLAYQQTAGFTTLNSGARRLTLEGVAVVGSGLIVSNGGWFPNAAGTTTVDFAYTSGTATWSGSAVNFGDVLISGAGTVQLGSNIQVQNLTLNAGTTLDLNGFSIHLTGNLSIANTAKILGATGQVVFAGASTQSWTDSNASLPTNHALGTVIALQSVNYVGSVAQVGTMAVTHTATFNVSNASTLTLTGDGTDQPLEARDDGLGTAGATIAALGTIVVTANAAGGVLLPVTDAMTQVTVTWTHLALQNDATTFSFAGNASLGGNLSLRGGTLDLSAGQSLTVAGSIALGDGSGAADSATLLNGAGGVSVAGGLTTASDGQFSRGSLDNTLAFTGSGTWSALGDDHGTVSLSGGTLVLGSDVTCAGYSQTSGSPTLNLSTRKVTLTGGAGKVLAVTSGALTVNGVTSDSFDLRGTLTWSGTVGFGRVVLTSGTPAVTLGSGVSVGALSVGTGSLTWNAFTVTVTGGSGAVLARTGGTLTPNAGGSNSTLINGAVSWSGGSWGDVSFGAAGNATLSGGVTAGKIVLISGSTIALNGQILQVGGDLTVPSGASITGGTTAGSGVTFAAAATWTDGTAAADGQNYGDVVIQAVVDLGASTKVTVQRLIVAVGQSIDLNGRRLTLAGSNAQPIVLNASATIDDTGGGGTLNFTTANAATQVITNNTSYSNLEINGAGNTYTLQGAKTLTSVSIKAGTLSNAGGSTTVSGTFAVGDGAGGNDTAAFSCTSQLDAGGNVSVASDGNWVPNGGTLNFTGTCQWSDARGAGEDNFGNVTVTGTASVTLTTNVTATTFQMTSGTPTFSLNTSRRLRVSGATLSITAGTLTENAGGTPSFVLAGAPTTWSGGTPGSFGDVSVQAGASANLGSSVSCVGLTLDGPLTIGSFTLTASGTVGVSTGITLTGGAGPGGGAPALVAGSLTLVGTANYAEGAGNTQVSGTLSGSGTWTDNATGQLQFTGGSASWAGPTTSVGNVVVNGGAAVTLGGNVRCTTLNVIGSLTEGSTRTLQIDNAVTAVASPLTISGTLTANGTTVFASGFTTTNVPALSYNNLQITGAGRHLLAAGVTLTGTLTVNNAAGQLVLGGATQAAAVSVTAGTLDTADFALTTTGNLLVGGNLTDSVDGIPTVNLNGSGNWSGTGDNFGNVTIGTAGAVTLTSNVIARSLSMTAGSPTLNLNNFQIQLTGGTGAVLALTAGTLTANATGTSSFQLSGNLTWSGGASTNFGDVLIDNSAAVATSTDVITRLLNVSSGCSLDAASTGGDVTTQGAVTFAGTFTIASVNTLSFTGGTTRNFDPGTSLGTTITNVEITGASTRVNLKNPLGVGGRTFVGTSATFSLEKGVVFNGFVQVDGTLRADTAATGPFTLRFLANNGVQVSSGATMLIDGTTAGGKIELFSTSVGTRWILDNQGGSTTTFIQVRVRDSQAVNAESGTGDDLGNNVNWSGLTPFTATWTNANANQTWDDPGNWLNNDLPISGSTVTFSSNVAGPANGTHPADLGGVVTAAPFNGTVTLTANLQVTGSMALNAGTFSTSTFDLTTSGGIAGVGTLTLTGGGNLTTGGGLTVTTYVDGAGLLTFNGSGTWSGASNFGQVVVEGGALVTLGSNVTASATAGNDAVLVRGGATLRTNGRTLTVASGGALTLGVAGVSNGTLDGTGNGGVSLAGNLNVLNASTFTNSTGITFTITAASQVDARGQNLGTINASNNVTLVNTDCAAQAINLSAGTFTLNGRTLTLNGSGTPLNRVGGAYTPNGTTIFAGTAATNLPRIDYQTLILRNAGTDTLVTDGNNWNPTNVTVESGATLSTPNDGFYTIYQRLTVESGATANLQGRLTGLQLALDVSGSLLTVDTGGVPQLYLFNSCTWRSTGTTAPTATTYCNAGAVTLVGDVTCGTLLLDATLNVSGFTLTVGGNLTVSAGNYVPGGGNLRLSGPGTWSGAGVASFGAVRLLSTANVILNSSINALSLFVESGGALNTNSQILSVAGNLQVAGAGFSNAAGQVNLTSGVASVWSGSGVADFGRVTVAGGASYSAASDLTAGRVAVTGSFDLGADHNLTLVGNMDANPLQGAGTFTGGTGTATVVYATTAAVNKNLAAFTFNNLTLNSAGSTFFGVGPATVNGTLALTAGTLSLAASQNLVAGAITGTGVLNLNGVAVSVSLTTTGGIASTVTLSNILAATIDYRARATAIRSVIYGNLTLSGQSGAGNYTVAGAPALLRVEGNLTINASTITSPATIELLRDLTLTGGATLGNSPTLSFLGSTSGTFNAGGVGLAIGAITVNKSVKSATVFLTGTAGAITRSVTGDVTITQGILNVGTNWNFRANTTVGSAGGGSPPPAFLPDDTAQLVVGQPNVRFELGGTAGAHLILVNDVFRVPGVATVTLVIGDGDTIRVTDSGLLDLEGTLVDKLFLESLTGGQHLITTTGAANTTNISARNVSVRDSNALGVAGQPIVAIASVDRLNNDGWSFQGGGALTILGATALDDGAGRINRVRLSWSQDLESSSTLNAQSQFKLVQNDGNGNALTTLTGTSASVVPGQANALEVTFGAGLGKTDVTDLTLSYAAPATGQIRSTLGIPASQDQVASPGGAVPLVDGAAPALISAQAQDVDQDGGLDRQVFFFSEPMSFGPERGVSVSGFSPATDTGDLGTAQTLTLRIAGENPFDVTINGAGSQTTGADIAKRIQTVVRAAPDTGLVTGHDPRKRPAYRNFVASFRDGRYVLRAGVPLTFDAGSGDYLHDYAGSTVQVVVTSTASDAAVPLKLGAGTGVEIPGRGDARYGLSASGTFTGGYDATIPVRVQGEPSRDYVITPAQALTAMALELETAVRAVTNPVHASNLAAYQEFVAVGDTARGVLVLVSGVPGEGSRVTVEPTSAFAVGMQMGAGALGAIERAGKSNSLRSLADLSIRGQGGINLLAGKTEADLQFNASAITIDLSGPAGSGTTSFYYWRDGGDGGFLTDRASVPNAMPDVTLTNLSGSSNAVLVGDADGDLRLTQDPGTVLLDAGQSLPLLGLTGKTVEFTWNYVSGPGNIQVGASTFAPGTNSVATTPSFNFSAAASGQLYLFDLIIVVKDGNGQPIVTPQTDALGRQIVRVEVEVKDQPPIAAAGPDQVVFGNVANLDGTGSFDPNGGTATLAYIWSATNVFGQQVTGAFNDDTSPTPTFTPGQPGAYTLTLTVWKLATPTLRATDQVVVSLVDSSNRPPVANAGGDQVVRVNQRVDLDGTRSVDPEGQTLTFTWTPLTNSATSVALQNPATATPSFTAASPGTYQWRLAVRDPSGLEGQETVTVVVIDDLAAQPRLSPEAVPSVAKLRYALFLAGQPPDTTVNPPVAVLPGGVERPLRLIDVVALTSDDPAPGATDRLLRVDVVGGATFHSRLYFALETGDPAPESIRYGALDPETVVAFGTVGETFILDGTRSQDDGVIESFTWTQTEGPYRFGTRTGNLLAVQPTTPGTYVFTLTVQDNVGLTSRPREVRVPVVPAGDAAVGPPLALASGGAGATTVNGALRLVTGLVVTGVVNQTVTLSAQSSIGRNTGALTGFAWTQREGALVQITGNDTATATFVPPVAGAYKFELKVTDQNGVSDTVVIWVTAAPAGRRPPVARLTEVASQTLPTSGRLPITLDGSGSSGEGTLTFRWSQVRGLPVILDGAVPGVMTATLPQAGTYEFELRVFDGLVQSAPATRTIVVQPTPDVALVSGASSSKSSGGCSLTPAPRPRGALLLLLLLGGVLALRRREG